MWARVFDDCVAARTSQYRPAARAALLATISACRQPSRCSSNKSCEFTSMLHSSQRQRGGGAGASSAASRARFFAPRFGFGSPGFLPEKCTVSPACTLNMRAVVTGAVTAAASALPAAAASELPAAASLRSTLAFLRATLAARLAALSSLLPVSEPASSCSSAKIRASSSLPMDARAVPVEETMPARRVLLGGEIRLNLRVRPAVHRSRRRMCLFFVLGVIGANLENHKTMADPHKV